MESNREQAPWKAFTSRSMTEKVHKRWILGAPSSMDSDYSATHLSLLPSI